MTTSQKKELTKCRKEKWSNFLLIENNGSAHQVFNENNNNIMLCFTNKLI